MEVKTFKDKVHASVFAAQVAGTVSEKESVSYLLPENFGDKLQQELPGVYAALTKHGDDWANAWEDILDGNGLPYRAIIEIVRQLDDQFRQRTVRVYWQVLWQEKEKPALTQEEENNVSDYYDRQWGIID